MVSPVLNCSFDCGVLASSGVFGEGHIHTGSGTPTFDTGIVRSSLRSIRFTPSASIQYVKVPIAATAQLRIVGRCYIRFVSLAGTTDMTIGRAANNGPRFRWLSASSTLVAAGDGTAPGTGGVAVVTGQFYRLDWDWNISAAGNDTSDLRVDGVVCTQASSPGIAAGVTFFELGCPLANTADFVIEDLVVSLTGADYPIGGGKGLSFVPNADGTHTATTTTIVKGTLATPVGGNVAGATDVFNWVNGKPLLGGATDNTRLVNQQTNGSTLYAEVDFEPSSEPNAPQAVDVITADRQAGTGTGDFQTKLNDNGTENAIVNRGAVAGVTSDRYANKQYATMPADSAAWTTTRFNALKARFGYSADANPDQYWRGIMIEADFADVPASTQRRLQLLGVG